MDGLLQDLICNAILSEQNRPPLHRAVRSGSTENVRDLLNSLKHNRPQLKKALFTKISEDKFTPLHAAAEDGREEIVKLILEVIKGDSELERLLFIKAREDFIPIHFAIRDRHTETVRVLLQSVEDNPVRLKTMICAGDVEDWTPLHFAAKKGYTDIVDLLLTSAQKIKNNYISKYINITTEGGYTALHLAAKNGQKCVADLLLSFKDADINIRDKYGYTCLHLAAQYGHEKVAELLLNHPDVKINDTDCDSCSSPLHLAVFNDQEATARVLLERGADVNVTNIYGKYGTPFIYAVQDGFSNLTECLVKFGADVNAKTAQGLTALHVRCQLGGVYVVKTLLRNGAYYDAFPPAEIIARSNGNFEISVLLNNLSKAFEAVKNDNITELQKILTTDFIVDARDSADRTMLHYAVRNNNKDIVKLLLLNGANPYSVRPKCNFLLHIAAMKGSKEIAEFLIENVNPDEMSAFLNTQSSEGNTALHIAVQNGHLAVVQCLLVHGAAFNIKNKLGKTPLDCCKDERISDLIELFIKLEVVGWLPKSRNSFPSSFLAQACVENADIGNYQFWSRLNSAAVTIPSEQAGAVP